MSNFFMNINSNKIPVANWLQRGLLEYLLVAHPDIPVGLKIELEKRYFSETYHLPMAARTQPHFTIANFMASEAMEPTMGKWMQHIIGAQHSFSVTLDNYSGFPPHTIYLRVQDPAPFQQLAKQLKPVQDYIRDSDCPPVKFVTGPHLTIARSLTENVYTKAMAAYAQKTFHESFMVEELVLIRRQHQFDKCKTIQVFKMRPAATDLFSQA